MSSLQSSYVLLTSLIFMQHICESLNTFTKTIGANGEDIWLSTSSFIPSQSKSYGTIRLGQIMSMEFDFVFYGRTNNPLLRGFTENFFRIGHDASGGLYCAGEGSRYPSLWLTYGRSNTGLIDISTTSGVSCASRMPLVKYGDINIAHSHHIRITINNTFVSVDISGGDKPDYYDIFPRKPTGTQYLGNIVPVWFMSNSYASMDYNHYIAGNATFSNITLISNIFTFSATSIPTSTPSKSPTKYPTYSPTNMPSKKQVKYSNLPTTENPTLIPTINPTYNPTISPTNNPTISPTVKPTSNPTNHPTNPTAKPTPNPSSQPTNNPTTSPTVKPTSDPTNYPTNPTAKHTFNPTNNPSVAPTNVPTVSPTNIPTQTPSDAPTKQPSFRPTVIPTLSPSDYMISMQNIAHRGHIHGIFSHHFEWFWVIFSIITFSICWMIGLVLLLMRRLKRLMDTNESQTVYVD